MTLPALVNLCRLHDIDVVAGSYALPVWLWGQRHVEGATYRIIRVVPDPDIHDNEFCPGKGFHSIDKGANLVRSLMPGVEVMTSVDIGSAYCYPHDEAGISRGVAQALTVKDFEVYDGEDTVVHPYTRHDWKNLNGALLRISPKRKAVIVGKPGEVPIPAGWSSVAGESFDVQIQKTLQSAGVVGILSSFTNIAAIFGKKQVIASFTADVPVRNNRAILLVNPSPGTIQDACEAMDL